MAVSYSRQIPPGGRGQVSLKVSTDGRAGSRIEKHATVYTDDPDHAKVELTMTGQVIAAAGISPTTARLIGAAGTPVTTEVTITPPAINRFDIIKAKAEDGQNIRFKLKKREDTGAGVYILHVENAKPDPGRYFDRITLTTTSKISPILEVRVFGIIRAAVEKHSGK